MVDFVDGAQPEFDSRLGPRLGRGMPQAWARSWLPWIGFMLLTMGSLQASLAASRSDASDLRVLGTGLLIAGGGASLIARGTHGSRRLLIMAGAAALGVTAGLSL